jgi:hypothetical protein
LPLQVILSFQSGVGCIELIIYTFFVAIQGVLPQALEGKKMEGISLNISKCGMDDCDNGLIMKSRNPK